jgi:hypothetical protein
MRASSLTLVADVSGAVIAIFAPTAVFACIRSNGPRLNHVGPAADDAMPSDFDVWTRIRAMNNGWRELHLVQSFFAPARWRR